MLADEIREMCYGEGGYTRLCDQIKSYAAIGENKMHLSDNDYKYFGDRLEKDGFKVYRSQYCGAFVEW